MKSSSFSLETPSQSRKALDCSVQPTSEHFNAVCDRHRERVSSPNEEKLVQSTPVPSHGQLVLLSNYRRLLPHDCTASFLHELHAPQLHALPHSSWQGRDPINAMPVPLRSVDSIPGHACRILSSCNCPASIGRPLLSGSVASFNLTPPSPSLLRILNSARRAVFKLLHAPSLRRPPLALKGKIHRQPARPPNRGK